MTLNRRQLIKSAVSTSIAGASVASLAPSMVFGQSTRKDDTLRIAAIGLEGVSWPGTSRWELRKTDALRDFELPRPDT